MSRLVGKAGDLVFDRGAVTGADPFDHTGVHGAAIQILADHLMGFLIGVSDITGNLLRMILTATDKRKNRSRVVTGLNLHHREIHAVGIDSGRSTGFQPIDAQWQFTQTACQGDGRWITGSSALVIIHTDMDQAIEKGSYRQHHGFGAKLKTGLGNNTDDGIAFQQQIITRLLKDPQVWLIFQSGSYGLPIQLTIRLSSSGSNGGAFGSIEGSKLDPGVIGCGTHDPAEGIDLLDQMTLANATDRRVA